MQPIGREEVAMSLLDQMRKLEQQVVDRLNELEPLTREYEQLRELAQRLGIKYAPGSPDTDGEAKPATTGRGRPRAGAGKRAARTPAKTQAARSATRTRAAKPASKPRGTRSTTGRRAARDARAAGPSGTAAPSRGRKRAASSGQRPGGQPAAVRPGQRHDDVLRVVGENPGITVREIGERLGVDATGLYRVVKRLTEEGRVRKDGTDLHPVGAAPASEAAAASASPAPARGEADTHKASGPAESEPSTAPTGPAAPADT
jgi:hypothetical protein